MVIFTIVGHGIGTGTASPGTASPGNYNCILKVKPTL